MKKRLMRFIGFMVLALSVFIMLGGTGCFAMYQIPQGYIGKVLYPSGFNNEILPPGQVNLGTMGCNQQISKLVICESTMITVVEQFRDAASSTMSDKADHRIMTKDGVPTLTDMYVRLMLPDDNTTRNQIFSLVTANQSSDDGRIYKISLQDIYSRFVEMDVRNRVRDIISKYENFQDILSNYSTVNDQVAKAVILAFQTSHVPLKLQDAQLSQVLPDPQVWDSEVKKKAAEALKVQIADLGKAIANNPGYLQYLEWQSLQNIAATGSAKGTNTLIIVTNGQDVPGVVVNPGEAPIPITQPAPITVPVPTPTK